MNIAEIRKRNVRFIDELGVHVRPMSIDGALVFEQMADASFSSADRIEKIRPFVEDCLCDENGASLDESDRAEVLAAIGFPGFTVLTERLCEVANMTEETQADLSGN